VTIAGVEPISLVNAACLAISNEEVDEIKMELSEKRESGWEIRMTLTVNRSRSEA
jgi:hypothetical protein